MSEDKESGDNHQASEDDAEPSGHDDGHKEDAKAGADDAKAGADKAKEHAEADEASEEKGTIVGGAGGIVGMAGKMTGGILKGKGLESIGKIVEEGANLVQAALGHVGKPEQLEIEFECDCEELKDVQVEVEKLVGADRISQLFRYEIYAKFTIRLFSNALDELHNDLLHIKDKIKGGTHEADYIPDSDAFILHPAALIFKQGDIVYREIRGIISEFEFIHHPDEEWNTVRIVLSPHAYRNTMSATYDALITYSLETVIDRCFQRGGLEKVVKKEDEKSEREKEKKKKGAHLASYSLDGLTASQLPKSEEAGEKGYPIREYIVQYGESDHAFYSRLCEHVGAFYFFDATHDDCMTFGDDNGAFVNADIYEDKEREDKKTLPKLPYRPKRTATVRESACSRFTYKTQPLPKSYRIRDYNYRYPEIELISKLEVDPKGAGEIVEYGAHAKTQEEADALARIRADELRCQRRFYEGESSALALFAGSKVRITDAPYGDGDEILIVTEITHRYGRTEIKGEEQATYWNEFKAIPVNQAFRPARITPKPRVTGHLTGRVEALPGYVVDADGKTPPAPVDGQGRYLVKMHFDTRERENEEQASHYVRRAQPTAGSNRGMHFTLKPGAEVTLTCVDGDPDRPIIAGAVPNPSTISPITAAEAHDNTLRTETGFFRMRDVPGEEGVKLTTKGGDDAETVFQLGAPNEPEAGGLWSTSSNLIKSASGMVAVRGTINAEYQKWKGGKTDDAVLIAGVPSPSYTAFQKLSSMIGMGKTAFEAGKKVGDAGMKMWNVLTDQDKDSVNKKLKEQRQDLYEKRHKRKFEPKDFPSDKRPKVKDKVKTAEGGEVEVERPMTDDELLADKAKGEPESAEEMKDKATYTAMVSVRELEHQSKQLAKEEEKQKAHDAEFRRKHENLAAAWDFLQNEKTSDAVQTTKQVAADVHGAKEGDGEKKLGETATNFKLKALNLVAQSKINPWRGRPLFSTAFKLENESINTVGTQAAITHAGIAGNLVIASTGRSPWNFAEPGKNYAIVYSRHTVVNAAETTAIVSGHETAVLASDKGCAFVVGRNTVRVASPATVEAAAGKTLFLTSSDKIDVKSRGTIEIVSQKNTTIDAHKDFEMDAKENVVVRALEKNMKVWAKEQLDLESEKSGSLKSKTWKMEATEKDFVMEVKEKLQQKAKEYEAKMEKAKIEASKEFLLKGPNGSLETNSSATGLKHGASELKLESSKAELKSGAGLTVQATKVDVKGKVFLG